MNEWTIADEHLEVWLEEASTSLHVRDRRCEKVWSQIPLGAEFTVQKVAQEGRALRLELSGAFPLQVRLELTGRAELSVTLSADPAAAFEKFSYPPAFQMPDRAHYLLLTDGAGLLLAADDAEYPLGEHLFYFCGGGSAMSWMGVTDAEFATGYMAIFETPFDAALDNKRVDGLVTFAPVWLSSMGRFSYERKLKYVFFDQGGYVAQCKRYREYIWPKNEVVTLRETQQRFPAIAKILGAAHIYVWDGARAVSFAQKMKTAGIEKALLLWDANHLPYPEKGYDERLKELGYGTGGYELFTDIHPETPARLASLAEIPLKRNVYPGLFDTLAARTRDGGHYSNQFGTYICPAAVGSELHRRVQRELSDYPHETYFVDVYQANGVYECYHPDHPQTRQQYAESIIANLRLLEDEYGLYCGGEWGADFTGSHGVFAHGMMTLQRTWFDGEATQKGTIYYLGDWKDNARPSMMLSERTAPNLYLQYAINETTRVPLYELVYHDAVVTGWRWEDCNHHTPAIWWKKDLFNTLYGTAPVWSLDQDRWAKFETTFIESYEKLAPWLQQICYDEMISHRFVSADRRVQETTFSSGKRALVNFGDMPFFFEDAVIAPRSFLIP